MELAHARKRIRELETELEITKKASVLFSEGEVPKRNFPVIALLVGQGYPPKQCCSILGVAPAGYFRWKRGPISQDEPRRQWVKQLIEQAHTASRGTYRSKRIRAELRLGLGIPASGKTVQKLMREQGLGGVPTGKHHKNLGKVATFEDLVQRKFKRDAADQLWVNDIWAVVICT